MPNRIVKPVIHPFSLSYTGDLDQRRLDDIDLVVIHCTEFPDMDLARVFGEKIIHQESKTGNCGHFYIDREGRIEQWVPLDHAAHHVRGFNPKSIGIELVNTGRYPHWFQSDHQAMTESYPDIQIQALIELLRHLETELSNLKTIAGHEDLDIEMLAAEDRPSVEIRRKVDPGPLFPWSDVMDKVTLKRVTVIDL